MSDFKGFLSSEGDEIFDDLLKHCKGKLKLFDADEYELAMLANSFALYAECARICNREGVSMSFAPKNGVPIDDDDDDLADDEKRVKNKGGQYQQIRPEYTVMKNEYQNILKHSGKFGLNPGDRAKIFKKLGDEK